MTRENYNDHETQQCEKQSDNKKMTVRVVKQIFIALMEKVELNRELSEAEVNMKA